jgi:hypothetical protein
MRRTEPLSFLACLALALAGCGTASTPTPSAGSQNARVPDWVSLERTAGGRTVYLVTLFTDGHVLFEGLTSVKYQGTFSKTIPQAKAAAIFAEIDRLQLERRPRRYDTETAQQGNDSVIVKTASTDQPWDTIRVKRHGQSVRIDGLFYAPSDITDLKKNIEESTGLAQWVGERSEWKY